MTTVELAKALAESIKRDGPLPVIIYASSEHRFEVAQAAPCLAGDHFLIDVGDRDRS